MPAWIDDGDAQLAHHDVVRIIRVADAIRVRACKHRIDLGHPGWYAVERDAEQLRMLRHDLIGEGLRVEPVRRRGPVLGSLGRSGRVGSLRKSQRAGEAAECNARESCCCLHDAGTPLGTDCTLALQPEINLKTAHLNANSASIQAEVR